jgi:hypothetical protein
MCSTLLIISVRREALLDILISRKLFLFLALVQGVVTHTELRCFIPLNLLLVLLLQMFTHQRVGY